jgi:hypothetical protein
MTVEDAFDILCNENILYMNNDRQIDAFFLIMKNEDAFNILKELLNASKFAVGEFYALLGIFEYNEACYHKIMDSYNISKEIKVKSTHHSDMIIPVSTVGNLVGSIENKVWLRNIQELHNVRGPGTRE